MSIVQKTFHHAICDLCGHHYEDDETYWFDTPELAVHHATTDDSQRLWTLLPDGRLICSETGVRFEDHDKARAGNAAQGPVASPGQLPLAMPV